MSGLRSLKVILLRENIPHISVSGKYVTAKVEAPTSGFEIFDDVKLKKNSKTNSENFANFCSKFGIIASATKLENKLVYGEFNYEFKNRSGSIAIWTVHHPVYDNDPKVS